jgi:hypothetical protein
MPSKQAQGIGMLPSEQQEAKGVPQIASAETSLESIQETKVERGA